MDTPVTRIQQVDHRSGDMEMLESGGSGGLGSSDDCHQQVVENQAPNGSQPQDIAHLPSRRITRSVSGRVNPGKRNPSSRKPNSSGKKPKKKGSVKGSTNDDNGSAPLPPSEKPVHNKTANGKCVRVCQDNCINFVTLMDGKLCPVSSNLGKTKVFGKGGEQLSKSCHQCQYQHIAWTCQQGKATSCAASYCDRCISTWYPGWTLNQLRECCPRCRLICNCRACLRKIVKSSIPEMSNKQVLEYAKHVLRVAGPHVKEFIASQEMEAGIDGVDPSKLRCKDSSIDRISCDECATSVPHAYRACDDCWVDLCIDCCKEFRRTQGEAVCPKCTGVLRLKGLWTPEDYTTLKDVAKAYGDCSGKSHWSWLGPDDGVAKTSRKRKNDGSNDGEAPSTSSAAEPEVINPNKLNFEGQVPSDWLLASQNPDGKQNYIYCPNASDFDFTSPRRAAAVRQFQECMWAGEPVLIRGIKAKMNWGPMTMMRACVDRGNKGLKSEATSPNVTVTDCSREWGEVSMNQHHFFNTYQSPAPESMLKVKDWPPDQPFPERLRRHNQDFMEALPLPEYMNPTFGRLNTFRSLPGECLPPDLGPKTYIALGRIKEHEGEGDSVTKMHMDMSDAFNIMCHAHYCDEEKVTVRKGGELWDKPRYGNAGAVWDIVRREDVDKVKSYLWDKMGDFKHHGIPVRDHRLLDPIVDQMFMLTDTHREELQRDHGVHMWHIEQHVWEAVYIPVGCPHQVRNLRSCLKAAIDFVPPESFHTLERLKDTNRQIAVFDKNNDPDQWSRSGCDPWTRTGCDKLQATAMLLHAAKEAYRIVEKEGKGNNQSGGGKAEDCKEESARPCRAEASNEGLEATTNTKCPDGDLHQPKKRGRGRPRKHPKDQS